MYQHEIRRLAASDYSELTRLWSRAGLPFRPHGRDSEEAIKAQMKASPDFFLGAFEREKLVGAVVMSSDLRRGWINRLAVDPCCRRHGIAQSLIKVSEETLRKHGVRIFCALIESSNNVSREVFKRCGYLEHRDILYFSKRDNEAV